MEIVPTATAEKYLHGRVYSFRRFTQLDDCSGRVGMEINLCDVTIGDDVTAGRGGTPVDDVTGETPVGGATLLARRRATNRCGSSAEEGSSAP